MSLSILKQMNRTQIDGRCYYEIAASRAVWRPACGVARPTYRRHRQAAGRPFRSIFVCLSASQAEARTVSALFALQCVAVELLVAPRCGSGQRELL